MSQIDIAFLGAADGNPLGDSAGAVAYEVTDHKPLPIDPPEPRLMIREVDSDQPLVPGVGRFDAATPRVESDGGPFGSEGSLLVNFLNVEPGQEDSVHAWFVEEHLPDLLALPGFISGRRFHAAAGQDLPYLMLNLWEVEPDVALESLGAMRAEREDALREGRKPKTTVHPALIADQRMGGIYRPLEPSLG
jgi:hypothetical protein